MKFVKVKDRESSSNGATWEANIDGQIWSFQLRRYYSPDTLRGSSSSCCECERMAGGNGAQKLTSRTRTTAVKIISQRIADGIY